MMHEVDGLVEKIYTRVFLMQKRTFNLFTGLSTIGRVTVMRCTSWRTTGVKK
jgi:hypothetical protein